MSFRLQPGGIQSPFLNQQGLDVKPKSLPRGVYARLAFSLLRAFLNWCSDRPEYRDQVRTDACIIRMAKDELPKKIAKDDCLQREQLPAWFAAVRQIGNPVIAAYLQTALLTGARREEVAGIRWEDVDFQWKALTIKDKVEGERTIPLTPYVAALLASLPRSNEWVFSSVTAASGRLQEPRIMHNKALTAADLPAVSIHGLRRSFGTLAEWVECPAGVSAQIMGHKPSKLQDGFLSRQVSSCLPRSERPACESSPELRFTILLNLCNLYVTNPCLNCSIIRRQADTTRSRNGWQTLQTGRRVQRWPSGCKGWPPAISATTSP
jgi:hypothetical protein